jgi:hypothetical protein
MISSAVRSSLDPGFSFTFFLEGRRYIRPSGTADLVTLLTKDILGLSRLLCCGYIGTVARLL